MTAELALTSVELGGEPSSPLLVLGPSLGTSVRTLWSGCAATLALQFRIIGWELPGHGSGEPAADFDIPALGAAVVRLVDEIEPGRSFHYAGDSVGGAVGLQLALDAPERLESATLICTGARIGEPNAWRRRATTVRAEGVRSLLDATPARWFGPAFAADEPARTALLADLAAADADSYATACEALAEFDVRSRLHEIATPVTAVAGTDDAAVEVATLREIAAGVQHGRLVTLDGVGHLAPAESPGAVAGIVADTAHRTADPQTTAQVRASGMRVRREVLGDAHVDRAGAAATDLTAEFQDMITQYAWGAIWTRPGLDRRSRSLITLTALVARGHHEELAMHLRAARTNGVTVDEIKELLMQTAVYCGVPDANTAFRIAQAVLAEEPP